MTKKTQKNDNPLRMKKLEGSDVYVLPEINCSTFRRDFIARANAILSFYSTTLYFIEQGHLQIQNNIKSQKPFVDSRMDLKIGKKTIIFNYETLIQSRDRSIKHQTNTTLIQIYGNFEAYIVDLVKNGLNEIGYPNPNKKTKDLMMLSGWPGKFDSISQELNVSLGKHGRVQKFLNMTLNFLNEKIDDPVDFLQRMANIRHLILHNAGRIDSDFVNQYPNVLLAEGDFITFPVDLPYDANWFLIHLSDHIDKKFCKRFGWKQEKVRPEMLL